MPQVTNIFDRENNDWQARMAVIVKMMREMSRQTDPQAMVRDYTTRLRQVLPVDRSISLSRRGMEKPAVRITRYSGWGREVNPWRERDHPTVIHGGLLADLIYGDEPRVIDDVRLAPDDPARDYLDGHRSLLAIPLYDGGESLNMVVLARRDKGAFERAPLPEQVWMGNLFGRATHNLVLKDEIKRANEAMDREMRVVADIQRALLPDELPKIPTLDLAASYETSARAGGDYYDFFALPGGRWGILIADVSGHGTPAAVIMAILHSIAHGFEPCNCPGAMLDYLNRRLMNPYIAQSGSFVTAFYGIYDPARRALIYASAGHNPPLLKRCDDGSMAALDGARGLPLCVSENEAYDVTTIRLVVGDQIIFYTDGITEAQNPAGEQFGERRLNEVLGACRPGAGMLIDAVHDALKQFCEGRPADDDRTMIAAKIV